jgi:cytochrome c-type biogenesis protein CcmH
MQWIDKALERDPSQPKALWLAATAATQQQDHARAISLWERLQSVLPPGSEDASAVAANLAEARNATPSGTSSNDSPQVAADGTVIRGVVKLDPALAGAIAGDETVFIFARAADGPRMPLAVVRKQASELPISFVLDDSMAMSPSMRLSDFPRVIVGARVSKSGNAMAQPGDLEGLSDVIDADSSPTIDIVIDRKNS